MRRLYLDFETHYTIEYSLKRLSVEAYCRDPRFQILLTGIAGDEGPAAAFPGVPESLAELASGAEVVCHNAAFDGFILETVLGVKAGRLACTRTMPRWTGLGWTTSSSLGSLAQTLGLGRKGDGLALSLGKRAEDFSPAELEEFSRYCAGDVELTRKLYRLLRPAMTGTAMDPMSLTLRMYTDPLLVLDRGRLAAYREEVRDRQQGDQAKLQRLFSFGDRDEFLKALRSASKFVSMLERLGAGTPTKTTAAALKARDRALDEGRELVGRLAGRTPTGAERARAGALRRTIAAGGRIPALAKDDQGFRDLLAHPDPDVALLARLRADNNSSIALSRAETFLAIAGRGPRLPIALAAWGAHTGRYAAGFGGREAESDRTNLQNLPKRGGDVSLRRCLRAPEGHLLVSGDSAQIEARVGAWLAGQDDLVAVFARGGDPYVEMAEAIYGVPAETIRRRAKADRDPEHVAMRDVGKTTMLSSQYGIGAARFSQYLLRNKLRLADDLKEHEAKAAEINRLYNRRFSAIADFRRVCGRVAWSMTDPEWSLGGWTRAGALATGSHAVGGGLSAPAVVLPNGFPIVYPGLRADGEGLVYRLHKGAGRQEERRLYGGALFNNLTQGLAFAILAWQGALIGARRRLALNVHDEWIAVVPEAEAEEAAASMLAALKTAPPWTPGLPLDAEVRITGDFGG